jgi:multidrug efflux pump subunit AcrA (membrane-fusion protein)
LSWGALALPLLLLAGCSRPAPPPEPVRAVKLVTVGEAPLQTHLEYAGEVRARVESRLGFRVAGKIVQRQAELGQRVQAGQVVAAGTPGVRIARDGPRDAVFSVPEDKVGQLRPGQPVRVRAWSQGTEMPGEVREVAASADPVTRTFQVKVAVQGGDVPPLGATVYVAPQALAREGVQAIKLPTSALRQEGGQTAVWVFEPAGEGGGTVRSQPVQIATADGNEAVVAAGLAPGMRVVATGVHVLAPGQKVTVYQSKSAQAQAGKAQAAINAGANASAAAR